MKFRPAIALMLLGLATVIWLRANTGSEPRQGPQIGNERDRAPPSGKSFGKPPATDSETSLAGSRLEARPLAAKDDAREKSTGDKIAPDRSDEITQPSRDHRRFAEKFESESTDEASSAELWQYFDDAFGDLHVDGAIDRLSCAETLCRVQAHFADVSHAMRFQEGAGMPERRKSIDMQVVDGQVDVEVYLSR